MRQTIGDTRAGTGRIYVGPEPPRGAHPGYRGRFQYDLVGVHLYDGCGVEACFPDFQDGTGWPMGEWVPIESDKIVPWHRVYLIELHTETTP